MSATGRDMGRWIEVEASVKRYVPDAMRDEFGAGGFSVFDATVLEVRSPAPYARRELRVFHDSPVAEGSMWRRSSGTLSFEIEEDHLRGGVVVFSGAVRNLRATG
jgi:hypothetical protein